MASAFFCLAQLDESRGEEYHKYTTLEKKRAPASTIKRLKQTTRTKKALASIKAFQKKYGDRGKEVVRFEWAKYKRILRPAGRRRWIPVRMDTELFYKRVYREDEKAELNWNNVATKPVFPRPVVPERAADAREQVETEYVTAIVEAGNHYSVRREIPAAPDGNDEVAHPTEVHFRLINTVSAHSRPHIVHTADAADDIENIATVAWEVIMETRMPSVATHDDAKMDARVVTFDAEPQWVRPWDITDFESLNKTLKVWRMAEPSTALVDCTALSGPDRAKVRFGVLDDRCPVLAIIQHLKNGGWNAVPRPITHTTDEIAEFDSREALRQKRYLQVCCRIAHCKPLTSAIPSRQVIHFYDCLLKGIAVEPNQRNSEYALVLNTRRQRDGKVPNLLPLADENVVPDEDDDAILGPVRPAPKPKPKPAPKRSVHASQVRHGTNLPPRPPPPCPLPNPDRVPVCGPGGGAPPPGGDDPIDSGPGESSEDEIRGAASSSTQPHPKPRAKQKALSHTEPGLTPGTEITWTDYVTPAGKPYPNFFMTCVQCLPNVCGRTRGDIAAFTSMCGEVEPIAFLHEWEKLPQVPGKRHNRLNPASGDVVAFAETHKDALAALNSKLRGRGTP